METPCPWDGPALRPAECLEARLAEQQIDDGFVGQANLVGVRERVPRVGYPAHRLLHRDEQGQLPSLPRCDVAESVENGVTRPFGAGHYTRGPGGPGRIALRARDTDALDSVPGDR